MSDVETSGAAPGDPARKPTPTRRLPRPPADPAAMMAAALSEERASKLSIAEKNAEKFIVGGHILQDASVCRQIDQDGESMLGDFLYGFLAGEHLQSNGDFSLDGL